MADQSTLDGEEFVFIFFSEGTTFVCLPCVLWRLGFLAGGGTNLFGMTIHWPGADLAISPSLSPEPSWVLRLVLWPSASPSRVASAMPAHKGQHQGMPFT